MPNDQKISELDQLVTPDPNDLLAIVDRLANETKFITVTDLSTSGILAPADPQYVTLAVHAALPNERVLTGTANQITVTDGGAGSTVTLSLPQSIDTGANVQFNTLILDATNTETLLVRKDSDGGDVFIVDTTNGRVGINGASAGSKFDVTGNAMIDGSADEVQLTVQAHSSQSTNIQEWESSAAAVLSRIERNGSLYIGSGSYNALYALYVQKVCTSYTSGDKPMSYYLYQHSTNASASAGSLSAMYYLMQLSGSNNATGGYGIKGLSTTTVSATTAGIIGNYAYAANQGTGTTTSAISYDAVVNSSSSGTTSYAYGLRVNSTTYNTSTISNLFGVRIMRPTNNATLTNAYGIKIEDQNAAATINYAIQTGTGANIFGDYMTIDQASATGAKPVLTLDQGDASEQAILISYDGADVDMILIDVDVTGDPQFKWDESEDQFAFSKGLDVYGASTIGDGGTTNYAAFAADGELTLAGTAKVTKTSNFVLNYRNITEQGKPTLVNQGVFFGFSMPVYDSDDEELFSCQCMPGDWDGTSDPLIYLGGWLTDANDTKKFNMQVSVETADFAGNDVVPATTNDYTIETETGDWAANTSFKVYVTVDASDIGLAAGQPLAIRIRRLDASENEIAGEVVVEGAILSYVSDKLGVAT